MASPFLYIYCQIMSDPQLCDLARISCMWCGSFDVWVFSPGGLIGLLTGVSGLAPSPYHGQCHIAASSCNPQMIILQTHTTVCSLHSCCSSLARVPLCTLNKINISPDVSTAGEVGGPLNSRSNEIDISHLDPLMLEILTNDTSESPNDSSASSKLAELHSKCMYREPSEFNSKFTDKNIGFSAIQINIRSLQKNYENLACLLKSLGHSFSIVSLSETWLKHETNNLYQIQGYDQISLHRKGKIGGGVALYVQNSLTYRLRKDLDIMHDALEATFIELDIGQTKPTVFGSCYHPPSSSFRQFQQSLESILHKVTVIEGKDVILGGDFNTDLSKINENNVKDLLDTLLTYGLFPTVSKPTRVTESCSSLLDNFFSSNLTTQSIETGVITSDISDHYCPYYFSKSSPSTKHKLLPKSRKFSPESIAKFNAALTDSFASFYSIQDANVACNELVETIQKAADEHFPFQDLPKRRTPKFPYITQGLLSSINRKNKLFRKYKVTCNPQHKLEYNSYRNKLSKLIASSKRMFYQKQIDAARGDSKKIWDIYKELLCKTKSHDLPTEYTIDGAKVSDSAIVSNKFNEYYTSMAANLECSLPHPTCDPISFLPNWCQSSITLEQVTSSEVELRIDKLKNKGPGHDRISAKIVKLGKIPLIQPLTHLSNLCLNTGTFPDILKKSVVKPVYKAGDKHQLVNYRPISLLPVISKILEKIIHERLYKFFCDNEILSVNQFGFRPKHSTEQAVITYINNITKNLENGLSSITVFLDLSRAFDTVNFEILLRKLHSYGIQGVANDLIKSYLSNRSQSVLANGFSSTYLPITSGVPQGSILGPLLFLIYVNDLDRVSQNLSFILYADDTTVTVSGSNPLMLTELLNEELSKLNTWFIANRLSLNVSKTKYQFYSNVDKLPSSDLIKISESKIERVSTFKFLGVIIDEKLKFDAHYNKVSNNVSKSIFLLNKVKSILTTSQLLHLYNAFLLPHLLYCCTVWGLNYDTRCNKLLLMQKKAIRIILNLPFLGHTSSHFKEHSILKFNELVKYKSLVIMFKFLTGKVSDHVQKLFTLNPRNTYLRHSSPFFVPFSNRNYRLFTLPFSGPKLWNSIFSFDDTENLPTLGTFKKLIKLKLINDY